MQPWPILSTGSTPVGAIDLPRAKGSRMLETEFDPKDRVLVATSSGTVTHQDYVDVFVPAVAAAVKEAGAIRLLHVFTSDFERFAPQAMWDDANLGLHHLKDITRLGIVADVDWVRHAAEMMGLLMPAEVRSFRLQDRAAADGWVRSG